MCSGVVEVKDVEAAIEIANAALESPFTNFYSDTSTNGEVDQNQSQQRRNRRDRIIDIDLFKVKYQPQLLSFCPKVEVMLGGSFTLDLNRVNLTHLSNLKNLHVNFNCNVQKLPPSLIKLIISCGDVTDLSNLTSLKELVIHESTLGLKISNGQVALSQSIEIFIEIFIEINLSSLSTAFMSKEPRTTAPTICLEPTLRTPSPRRRKKRRRPDVSLITLPLPCVT
ncbi:hypothetical protein P9112_009927 [Eukaryota sp. TZLM1-RC]